MTTLAVEKLREKVAVSLDQLHELLDSEGHGQDCVLRCFNGDECPMDHGCNICGDDE